jgi:hypothetical protein
MNGRRTDARPRQAHRQTHEGAALLAVLARGRHVRPIAGSQAVAGPPLHGAVHLLHGVAGARSAACRSRGPRSNGGRRYTCTVAPSMIMDALTIG